MYMKIKKYWPIKSVWLASLFLATGLLCYDASAEDYFKETKVKAENGDAAAQCTLGSMYDKGVGVEKDYTSAVKWYLKSAEQNHSRAQFSLGVSYYKGEGVEKDYAEAVKWWRKSAEQNNSSAQVGLGGSYQFGHGVEKDYSEAYAWYNLAAIKITGAAEFRDDLENKMSPQQIADAQQRTKQLRALIDSKTKNAK